MKKAVNNNSLDVAVIGNIGIDTNVYFQNGNINFDVETNFTEDIDYVGQAGGYTSRGFSKLGYKTAFIGYIGDDFSGKFILDELHKDDINTDGIFIDPAGTSRSVNLMYQNGKRKNFYDGKSHMTLSPDLEACRQILQKTKLAHFHIPNWARHLLPIAKELGIIISTDIQDVIDINDPYRADFIAYSDVVFFSSVNQKSPDDIMNEILNVYPEKIVISGRGEKGVAVGTKDGIQYFEPIKMNHKIIDTNGAGDGLAVGFLTGYFFENLGLEKSIEAGQTVARYTCGLKANSSDLMNRELLNSFLKK